MRNGLLILMVSILLLPLVPGCGGGETRRMMDRADSLIVSDPEVALAILDDIPESSRSGGATEARYNMLHTEASYRALDDTILPDSAIAASVAYYSKKEDRANAARARYNLALLKMQRKAYSAATVDLLMAANDANNSDTGHFLRGLIYRALGFCFAEFYDMSTAITYQKRAYKQFITSGDSLHAGYVLAEIAARYLDIRKYDYGKKYADEAVKFSKLLMNDGLYVSANLLIADCLIDHDKSKEAIALYEELYSIDSMLFEDVHYVNWGLAYLKIGDTHKTKLCNSHVKSLEKAMNSIDVNILMHEGRYKECSELLISTFDILDSVRNTVWTRNDISVINDYYKMQQEESAHAIEQEKTRRNAVIIVSALVLLLGLGVYIIIVVTLRKRLSDSMVKALTLQNEITGKESQLNAAKNDLSDMESKMRGLHADLSDLTDLNGRISDSLKESNDRLAEARTARDTQARRFAQRCEDFDREIHGLLATHFSLVSKLLEQKYDLEQNPNKIETVDKESERISQCVHMELDKFVKNPNLAKDLEEIINSKLDNLIRKLRADFPDFNEKFINMYIFSLLKFSSAAIATLQKSSLYTVYSRKSKLKRRLLESQCERKDLYLKFFS